MKTKKSPPGGRAIQSVDRAIEILNALAREPNGLKLSELASRTSLPPQTAQSLLRTLERRRWVVQTQRGQPYCLGPGAGELHHRWLGGQDRIALARPAVKKLSKLIGEYTILAELRATALIPLVESDADQMLAVRAESVSLDRIHIMATGKLLMAYLDEARRTEMVHSLNLTRHGPGSVTDPTVLLRQLDAIRSEGYVVCKQESSAGVAALAVAVRNAAGHVMAALGTAVPMVRFSPKRRRELLKALKEAAGEITEIWDEVF